MRPIFNEKVDKKCILWVREQYTETLFTEDLVNNYGLEKKKKTQKEKTWTRKRIIQTLTICDVGTQKTHHQNVSTQSRGTKT